MALPKTDLFRFPSLLNAKCIHAPQMQTTEVVTNVLATNFVPQPRLTGRLSVFTTHQTLLLNSRSHVQKNSRPNNQSGGDPEVAGRNRKREGRSASHLNVIRGAPTRARCDWLKGGRCRPTPPSRTRRPSSWLYTCSVAGPAMWISSR